MVATLQDITQLKNFAGASRTIIVTDPLRGGVFNWGDGALTDNDGTIFTAIGVGDGFWIREINNDEYYASWFGLEANDLVDQSSLINATINTANFNGGGYAILPQGVTYISNTVRLKSNVVLKGAGMSATTIRNLAAAVTDLDLITPLDGATVNPDIYTYRTMIATDGADYTSPAYVENVGISDLGVDWNSINGGVNSVLPIAFVRVTDSEITNVQIYDALPADLESLSAERQGHGLLLGFATNNKIHKNIFGASDYETVAVRYLSDNNHISDNIFNIDKPDTFHWQSHAMQFARPTALVTSMESQFGESKIKNNYVYNNDFYLVNNVLHAFTSHSSVGAYVNYNYIQFYDGTLAWGLKFFDETTDFSAIGNMFYAVGANTNTFPATSRGVTNQGVTFIGINSTSTHDPVANGIISNNIIVIENTTPNAATVPAYVAPMIGGNNISTGSNITISNNVININGYDDYAKPVFGIYGDGINVIGNTVNLVNPFVSVTDAGLQYLRIKNGKGITVSNNIATGTSLGKGIVIDNTAFEDIILNNPVNYQATVVGDKLTTGLTNQAEITIVPLSINGAKADADGNVDADLQNVTDAGNFTTTAIGIGSAVPSNVSRLHIGTGAVSENTNSLAIAESIVADDTTKGNGINVEYTVTLSEATGERVARGATMGALLDPAGFAATLTSGSVYGASFYSDIIGATGVISAIAGFATRIHNNGNNPTITKAYGGYIHYPNSNVVPIGEATGLLIHEQDYNGAATYGINLEINAPTATTVGADYSIYNASVKQNYFNGNLGLGVAVPTEMLDVLGNGKFSGTVTLAGLSNPAGSSNSLLQEDGSPVAKSSVVRNTTIGALTLTNIALTSGDSVNIALGKLQAQTTAIVNATTTALSASDLNTAYPSVIVGTRVICKDIIAGGLIYTKVTEAGGSDVWVSTPATIVV